MMARPTRGHVVITNRYAVDVCLKHPQAGNIKTSLLHLCERESDLRTACLGLEGTLHNEDVKVANAPSATSQRSFPKLQLRPFTIFVSSPTFLQHVELFVSSFFASPALFPRVPSP